MSYKGRYHLIEDWLGNLCCTECPTPKLVLGPGETLLGSFNQRGRMMAAVKRLTLDDRPETPVPYR